MAKKLKTVHIEQFKDLVDDLWYSYLIDDGIGLEISDMKIFLRGCSELCRKVKFLTVFQLSCLCVSLSPASVPDVQLVWAMTLSKSPDLGNIIELL